MLYKNMHRRLSFTALVHKPHTRASARDDNVYLIYPIRYALFCCGLTPSNLTLQALGAAGAALAIMTGASMA